ncbi:MAG: dihydrodipicolinate reductase C-terminal domain-containing protein [Spirochaetales bacterium]|nr:dihydrodipicolinate reductase C-terminal domain-containing protein [Spirochaetales bacterium]
MKEPFKECIVVGNGKLAEQIKKDLPLYLDITVKSYEQGTSCDGQSVFVHIGSGRQYEEALARAIEGNSCFIQAATEKDIKLNPPSRGALCYLHAPNLDLNIVKFFYLLSQASDIFKGEASSVTESHQAAKTSVPGTAYKICDYLDFPKANIESIRDPDRQSDMGIGRPEQHAYHRIQFGGASSHIALETYVEGLESYVTGLAKIIGASVHLDKQNYEVEDLLKLNLL